MKSDPGRRCIRWNQRDGLSSVAGLVISFVVSTNVIATEYDHSSTYKPRTDSHHLNEPLTSSESSAAVDSNNVNEDSNEVNKNGVRRYFDALSFSVDYQVNAQSIGAQTSRFFSQQEASQVSKVNGVIDVGVQFDAFSGSVALLNSDLYNSVDTHSRYYQERSTDLVVREAVIESSFMIGDREWDMLAGKARIDWGVGYGYRVLDLFNPYRRNPVGIQIEEGAGTLAVSHYGDQSELTFITTDSSWTQLTSTEFEKANEQQGLGMRYYTLLGDSELQAITYYDNVREGMIAGSFVTVFGDAWEVHSSASLQRRYLTYTFADQKPATLSEGKNAVQYLVGITWAHESGNSVIAEYWYDERAWSQSQWQHAYDAAANVYPIVANSYGLGYTQQNLVQHSVMLHWALDPSAWANWQWSRELGLADRLTPKIDVMISPEDGGVIATQWLDFMMLDNGNSNLHLELAARYVAGADSSVYANLPERYNMLINIKGRF
ncbi:hypothetical protein [Vibrio sp. 10N.261.51.F12]|uniref:hypothetical protein n=1 Tax=Vibrio sp. 10N.261.51.F12 TaxID=3229679 RepID=UPI00354F604D